MSENRMEMPKMVECSEKKMNWLRSQIIGKTAEFNSPFGKRRITYADSTASARSLHFIEDYILTSVLPFYGNTHTSDTYVGQHSSTMVNEAGQYIKMCLGGGEEDAILFCGSGATSSIKKLQEIMGITVPSTLRGRVSEVLRNEERWIVFVGLYEHHSNLLSWRQSLAEVVEIGLTEDGGSIDMEALRTQLQHYEGKKRPMLGSFSACSNVTGIITDTREIASLLHKHGAFACFDFAASGPYVDIYMRSGEMDGYDAVFVSPHKFIGGPGTPGILLMSKKLYQLASSPPSTCGGGTVSYVNGYSEEETLYLNNVEERENAGTPPIIQTIRAALAFWVKEYIGYKTIDKQEHKYMSRALNILGNNKNIETLGNKAKVKRLPILSFLIYPTTKCDSSTSGHISILRKVQICGYNPAKERDGKPLHGRFVAKLLSDLFGVQARGGCACAGPYGHYLLNVDEAHSQAFRSSIQQGYEGVKPAWTRVCFPYYMSTEEFKFIMSAVEFVASYGLRFLTIYDFDWRNGNWTLNEEALKSILKENDINITSNNVGDDLRLARLMEGVMLRYNSSKVQKVKDHDATSVKDRSLTDSYMEMAKYMASILPKCPKQRTVPERLNVELPFKI